MILRLQLFLKEFILFGTTMVISVFAAYKYSILASSAPIIQAPTLNLSGIVFLAIVITFFVMASRMGKLGKIILWLFLGIVIWSGTQIVAGSVASFPWDLGFGLIILALFVSWRTVLMHDIAMVLSLAGVGAAIGVSVSPTIGIIALVILSIYDIIAVYVTRHMVHMAQGMVASGAVFGFIIPNDYRSFLVHRRDARGKIGTEFMILGSGDIVLPVLFVASLMRESLQEAIIVAIFAAGGVFLTHLLFVGQRKRQAMAALPPIATMCLVGYLISLLI